MIEQSPDVEMKFDLTGACEASITRFVQGDYADYTVVINAPGVHVEFNTTERQRIEDLLDKLVSDLIGIISAEDGPRSIRVPMDSLSPEQRQEFEDAIDSGNES